MYFCLIKSCEQKQHVAGLDMLCLHCVMHALCKVSLKSPTYHTAYRIVLNSRPGVYFLPEVLDPALIRDRRLIETGVK